MGVHKHFIKTDYVQQVPNPTRGIVIHDHWPPRFFFYALSLVTKLTLRDANNSLGHHVAHWVAFFSFEGCVSYSHELFCNYLWVYAGFDRLQVQPVPSVLYISWGEKKKKKKRTLTVSPLFFFFHFYFKANKHNITIPLSQTGEL